MSPHMSDDSDAGSQSSGNWLSIDAACQMLGVDQSTLRRWSDSGKVPVFRTPGGHRRYNEDDLKALMQGDSRPRRRMSRQVLTDMSFSGYESDFIRQVRSRAWYRAYDTKQVEELRALGRRLVDLAIRSIAGRADQRQIIEDAEAIGRRYGTISAAAGLSADDAVEAFLFFRYPVIQAMTRFIEEEGIPAKRSGRIFVEISQFLDRVLVATVSAHTRATS